MPRNVVRLVGLGAVVVLVGTATYLFLNDKETGHARKAHSADEARQLSDHELLEAVARGNAPWDLEELKARCATYSDTQLQTVVEGVVDMAFTMPEPASWAVRNPQEGLWAREFLDQARDFLPVRHAEEARKRAWKMRTEAAEALEAYVESQYSYTPEDAERLYQIYVDLDDPTKYPQVELGTGCLGSPREWLQSQALEALTHCGEPGLEKLRQLGQSGPELATALAGTGNPEHLAELVALCRQTPSPKDRLACLSVLARLEADRRTVETRQTLREGLPPFLESADPRVRISAAHSAGSSGDTFFLAALEDLAANDPYFETRTRSQNDDQEVHYEFYTVRVNATHAIKKLRGEPGWVD